MSEIKFGELSDVRVREAWPHEAINFTPWLADNLSRLSNVVGMDLELIETESLLPTEDDSFSVDIFARDLRTNDTVVIENQIERTDHKHLGQVLTYLAGKEAKTVIWIATSFREAHLAAIKWLNEHTTEEFSFFAIKLRVVQIENSPLAPVLDVLEKPNRWEKKAQTSARAAKEISPLAKARMAFWRAFQSAYPEYEKDGSAKGQSAQWRVCGNGAFVVSYYLAQGEVGVFVRGPEGVTRDEIWDTLREHEIMLKTKLGSSKSISSGWFSKTLSCDFKNQGEWTTIMSWLNTQLTLYEKVMDSIASADHAST